MKKKKYSELLKGWEDLEREILLVFSKLSAGYVIEDHVEVQYVTDHVVENYDL